jgi:hypothetical protein
MYHDPKGKLLPLTFAVFDKLLKTTLSSANYDPILFSGHSFRRGGATWAFSCGFTSDAIKLLGDWKSDSFLLYIHLSFNTRLTLAQKFAYSLAKIH